MPNTILHHVKVLPLGFLGAYGLPAAPYGRLTAVCRQLAGLPSIGDKKRGRKRRATGVLLILAHVVMSLNSNCNFESTARSCAKLNTQRHGS